MTALTWDGTGDKEFETGVDHAVLYILNTETAAYDEGYAWNGITAVNEKPDGAAASPQYADNIKYLNLLSAETFGGTIEAFTYPDEFGQCDGTVAPVSGLTIGQQPRATFGLSYRTKVGNDVDAVSSTCPIGSVLMPKWLADDGPFAPAHRALARCFAVARCCNL